VDQGLSMIGSELTPRQRECLILSATMTDKEIARELGLSPHTVSLHIRQAMARLDAPSRKSAYRKLAGKPLYGALSIPSEPESSPHPPISSPTDCVGQLSERERASGFSALALAPAYMPAPPRIWGSRIWLILLAGILVLIFGAVFLGLLGFVSEVANRWAVDPSQH